MGRLEASVARIESLPRMFDPDSIPYCECGCGEIREPDDLFEGSDDIYDRMRDEYDD